MSVKNETLILPAKKLGIPLMPDYCPRCHYVVLRMRGPFPFAPFPQIFSAIDRYTKDVFEAAFKAGRFFPALKPFGTLTEFIEPQTHHTFAVEMDGGVVLRGSPDAVFRRSDGSVIIGDYKTAKAKGDEDPLFEIYRAQLSAYAYIMSRREDEHVAQLGLIYTEPVTKMAADKIKECLTDEGFVLPFEVKVHELQPLSDSEVESLAATAREVYDAALPPDRRTGCRSCDQMDQMLQMVTPQCYEGASASLKASPLYEIMQALSQVRFYAKHFGAY